MSEKAVQDGAAPPADAPEDKPKPEPKQPFLKRVWTKSGLTLPQIMLAIKGSCGPVIALALFQLDAFANFYTTIGYLVAIVTILSFPIMPRAKFFQTMAFNIIGVCIGACINLLTCYCAIKAREHTSPPMMITSAGPAPGAVTVPYNSSASAVAAIWLFFNVMFSNAVRFKLPQLQGVIIIYSINANISAIYSPQFPNMVAAEAFVKKLLLAFLGGFGVATVVHLVVFPMTCRQMVQAQMNGYLMSLKGVMAAERDYLQSMESGDLRRKKKSDDEADPVIVAATKKLNASVIGITELHSKLAQDLTFAKREFAWGKLDAKDLDTIFKLLRQILLPSLGISSVADVFERVAEGRGWDSDMDPKKPDEDLEAIRSQEKEEWNDIMKTLHEPFQTLVEAMSEGLTHISYVLELAKRPKKKDQTSPTGSGAVKDSGSDDVEASAGAPAEPGDDTFREQLAQRIKNFSQKNKDALHDWCAVKGLTDSVLTPEIGADRLKEPFPAPTARAERERRHLYMILYLEFLLWSTAKAVLDLVDFADGKVSSGKMKHSKLIYPGKKRLRKWFWQLLQPQDSTVDNTPDSAESGYSNINVPSALRKKKDPEHMEPTNAFERAGGYLKKVGRAFESTEMAFGFRVACATLSVGIMAYLEETQAFFTKERLIWAQIMVAISMSITSGSGIFGFILRIVGTLVAAIIALVLWYIAGGRGIPGALLPLLFVAYLPQAWALVRYPRFVPVFMILMITQVLILGYELEADKVGLTVLESNGQAYHPIYIFAWIRLATVCAGLAVAFFWTYIPYPITAKNAVRRRLADSIYLLASYYSCVHATIGMRLENVGGDPDDKGSPAHQLRKTRFKIIPKMLGLLAEIRQHLAFTKFELAIGGKFPKQQYADIITEVNNIFNYMSLMDYATATYATARTPDGQYKRGKEARHMAIGTKPSTPSSGSSTANETVDNDSDSAESCHGPNPTNKEWLKDLARARKSVNITTEDITSLLSLMSFAISNGHPLPPFLRGPSPYLLSNRIRQIDPEVLSVRHITEPGYAAFAVTQVASRLISHDLEKLLKNVRDLVGEVDFTYHPNDAEAMKLGEMAQKQKTS